MKYDKSKRCCATCQFFKAKRVKSENDIQITSTNYCECEKNHSKRLDNYPGCGYYRPWDGKSN